MLLKISSGVFKGSWWLLLIAIVLFAIYMLLGRYFAYSVASHQEDIEQYLRDNGLPYLEVGSISGDWKIHDPWLELNNLVLAPDGVVALEIDHVSARLSSVRSILNRGPVLSEIRVAGVRFALERAGAGFRVKGLPAGNGSFNSDYLLDSVAHINHLSLSEVELSLEEPDLDLTIESIAGAPVEIRAFGKTRKLMLPFSIGRRFGETSIRKRQVVMSGEYNGDPRTPGFTAELFLDAPNVAVLDYLPEIKIANRQLTSLMLDTRLWLRVHPGDIDLSGTIAVTELSLEADGRQLVDQIDGTFRFSGASINDGSLSIPAIKIRRGDAIVEVHEIGVVVEESLGDVIVAGSIPSVQISSVMRLLGVMGDEGFISDRLDSALRSVSPDGELNEIYFKSALDGSDAKIVSRLNNFSIDAYLGVPAITNLNGFVSLEPDRGYLDIDNDDFVMDFSEMFTEPWDFDSGRGRVSYQVLQEGVSVSSGIIELIKGDLEAYGKVVINLLPDRDAQTWGLSIGIQNAELLSAYRYIPKTISQDVLLWLDSAIKGGSSSLSGVTVHGALYRGAPQIRKAYDFFLDVEDAVIEYHPEWPQISEVMGNVHVSNYEIRSGTVTGRALDSEVVSALVNAPVRTNQSVDTVLVEASIRGPFEDGIRVLNESPLSETTSGMAEQWGGSGELAAKLDLNVPIGPRSEEEVHADVSVEFSKAALVMPEFDLRIDKLHGTAHYATDTWLTSSGFEGEVFGERLVGAITTETGGEGGEIRVSASGQVAAPDLFEWSQQILISRASGVLGYEATIHVPFGGDEDQSYVLVRSDLSGATIDLPYPLGKQKSETKHRFEYQQQFLESGFIVNMSLDDLVDASLKIEDGLAVGGRIHLGEETMGVTTYDAIRLTGEIPSLDFEAWLDTFEQLSAASEVALEAEAAEHVESLDLKVGELHVYGFPLMDADVFATRKSDAWNVHLENEMLLGDVLVPDQENSPIELNLSQLVFKSEGEGVDPLGEMDPLSIDPVIFATEKLIIDDEDYGSWSFNYGVKEGVAHFEKLTASAAGVQILPVSKVEWRFDGEQHTSRFTGDVVVENLADALTKFGFATSVEGSGLKLKPDFTWPGSPAMIDVDYIQGDIEIQEGNGRFVQAETGGALKLLGIFDFASIARRLRFDFSDVVKKGFEFQDIKGTTAFDTGQIAVKDPIVITGTSGSFTIGGTVNLNTRELDNDMIVTLPFGRTLPWYAAYSAIATGPLAGVGVILAQKVFENQINQMSSARYKVSGSIEEPNIEFVSIFSDKVREADTGTDQ